MVNILAFFSSMWFRLGLALAIFGAGAILYMRVNYLADRNEELSTALKSAIERNIALDTLLTAQRAVMEEERSLLDEVDKEKEEKPENDADTAPVLLNALQRLRQPPAP